MQLTYDEVIEVLDLKYVPSKRIGYTILPGKYEVSDLNKMIEH